MNLEVYHKAWMQGFSEKECCDIAEEQWQQDLYNRIEQERLDREYEKEYYEEIKREYEDGLRHEQ